MRLLWGLQGPRLPRLAPVRFGRACHPLRPRKYCIDARRHHIPLLDRMAGHGDRVAVTSRNSQGEAVHSSYRDIMRDAHRLASTLEKALPPSEEFRSQRPPRVAVIMPRDRHYVTAMAAVWLSSLMFVPIHYKHPKSEVEYILRDSAADIVLVHPSLRHLVPPSVSAKVDDRAHQWVVMEYDLPLHAPPEAEASRLSTASTTKEVDASDLHVADTVLDQGALLIYTSGTTGKPKGVLSSHRVLSHQITSLVQAWHYTHTDRLLHMLPLHHLHGLLNKLLCVLWVGGTVEFAKDTSPEALWRRLAAGSPSSAGSEGKGALSMFMAVPTIYALMMQVYRDEGRLDAWTRGRGVEHLRSMRLVASGSAALPVTLFRELESVTGQPPLERYGMTELGMVLSNHATQQPHRTPGHVGLPMPGVQVRVVDPETEAEVPQGQQGELRVKGPTVFLEYWRRPEATREAFDAQGWFKTGDVAIFNTDKNSFQLLGRLSSDIIKSGGYKISSLEIEEAIREHDAVAEVVVVGRPHAVWGEEIVAVIRLRREGELDVSSLQAFLSSRLAKYKLPTVLHLVQHIPKNAMGKVNKKTLLSTLGLTAPPQ